MMRRNSGWLAFLGVAVGVGVGALAGCTGRAPDKDSPAAQGCVKDTDCKGDRVCVSGQCQDAPARPGAAGPGNAPGAQPGAQQPGAQPNPVPAPAVAAPTFRAVPEAEWKPVIGPRLRIGAIVAHAVFVGPIGPSAQSLFVVTREADQFHATVWADGRGYRNSPLANNGGVASKVPAVSFFDADGDGTTDALVMATYAPSGGGGPDAYDNVLLRWNGTALVRMHNLEANIKGLESVAAVRAKLRR